MIRPPSSEPLVSVVTPVYNGVDFLAECIESVLAQTYSNWELIILDNCSSDGTYALAQSYAERDSRIKVVAADVFVGQIPNLNRSLRLMSPHSKYCKMLLADDWLFQHCLEEMVAVAELDANVGLVGSYSMYHNHVSHFGLPYRRHAVFSGREVARRYLLEQQWFLGSPTCVMFRSDLVRARDPFFVETGHPFADTEAFIELLKVSDFGFVFQLLTFNRRDNGGHWERIEGFEPLATHNLMLLVQHGSAFIEPPELERHLTLMKKNYYFMLSENALRRRGKAFWDFHRNAMAHIGWQLERPRLAWGTTKRLADMILNPKRTVERLLSPRDA
jgi:glycosyltransferase involved in cell wall biosynthesis